MSVRTNWTAREGLTFSFADPINDASWKTNITTIKQLGAPGLEGDVWHVELEDAPHGITESAVKVFKANFDMQTECLDPINEAETGDIPLTELLPLHARSFVAEATASIENEYFIRPYAFGRMANRNAILMPVIKGDNLSDYIRSNPDISADTRYRLCSELCRAIDSLHETGQLHNDIKPDNIMIDTSGSQPTVRIIDMGFLCNAADVKSIHGGSRKHLGTPGYMSPEIRGWGAGTASEASDTWSVGCTIFYILTSLELVTGVLDKKSEDSQNALYNSLRENMDEPMISIERMARVPGCEQPEIMEALSVLLTPNMKIRRRKNQPLLKMAEACEGVSSVKISPSPVTKPVAPTPVVEPTPKTPRKRKVTPKPSAKTSTASSEDVVKVFVRPAGGFKQIVVIRDGDENYLRHQHVPEVDTSHSKLIRFTYNDHEVYALPRDGLPGLKFNDEDWAGSVLVPKEGATIEIDGIQIQLELR